jgi:diguanylate cyclase (GGDEF)-like protein
MKLHGTFLRSRVARRIFTLFLLSALIPSAGIAFLSIRQVDELLLQQTRAELAKLSKAHSMALYERLLLAEDLLQQLAPDLSGDAHPRSDLSTRANGKIASLSLIRSDATTQTLFGATTAIRYVPSADQRHHLAEGKTILFSVNGTLAQERVFMLRALSKDERGRGYLLAELDLRFLWGDPTELPYRTDVCVFTEVNEVLYCSTPTAPPILTAIASNGPPSASRELEWTDRHIRYLAGYYRILLKPKFFTHGWTVVVSQPESEALATASAFMQLFLPVLALAILLVVMLSVTQIRRTLVPLERLIDGTRRIAAQDFGDRIDIARRDEFGELADSFNTMASRLGKQFHALTTLSEIDRVILSTLDVDRVLAMILARFNDVVPADYICITIADPDSADTARSHVRDYHARRASFTARTQLQRDEIEQIAAEQDTFWVEPGAARKGYLAPLAAFPATAFLVLPIAWKDKLSGIIVLGYRTRPVLTGDEMAHARDFRDRLGVALSTAARDEQLYYQARYDALTGLPNRLYFKDQLSQELLKAARAQTCLAVLFVDLDHFKNVNDTAGHSAGDVVLQEVARRLKQCSRESDFIARLGGDEFMLLLPGITTPESAGVFADKVVQVMARPFLVEGEERFLSASVGIGVYPHDGTTADALVKNADTAMYRAKATGRNRSVYFEDRMNVEARARVALERELRRAVAQGEFELHYQPQLDLRSGEICGAEALLRWNHPQRGLLLPSHFIGLAEEIGLIEPLGRWILDQACAQYQLLALRGIRLNRLSVNVSARQFRQSDFVDFVARTVAKHEVLPLCLELEITESLLMSANNEVNQALRALKDLGIRLAIDDFGTGYSSLAYLKQFSFDVVKIDKSFVKDLETNAESHAITSAIVAMAHALRKEVVAEGVETEGQLAILRSLACDQIQGFLFAETLEPHKFTEFAAARIAAVGSPAVVT